MNQQDDPHVTPAHLPDPQQRLPAWFVEPPHPALSATDQLLAACDLRTQRRSGPGGQHRNKTSSGAYLTHRATGLIGEATERRSQAQNRTVALQRLRYRLAVEVRTPSILDAAPEAEEAAIRRLNAAMRMSDTNESKPAILALVLNDLHAAGGQPSVVAPLWKATTSGIVTLVKSHPAAFQLVNRIRSHHHRGPLK